MTELEQRFEPVFTTLRSMPGVVLRGNVRQHELAREFMRSAVLAYPCTFEETSCITAIEAMAGGCAIVTSRLGALPETLADAAVFVEGEPGSKTYTEQFARSIINILSDSCAWSTLHERSLKRSVFQSWQHVAKELTVRLSALLMNETRPNAPV
jgi:glycosyltransferase involved in cell wall biosynthesis